MTYYQLYSRLRHFFVARHYRGHGIHSPSLYDLVRQVFMKSPSDEIERNLAEVFPNALIISSGDIQVLESQADIKIVLRPFKSSADYRRWCVWRAENACQSVWLKSALVIFHDPRLQNQHFDIRS